MPNTKKIVLIASLSILFCIGAVYWKLSQDNFLTVTVPSARESRPLRIGKTTIEAEIIRSTDDLRRGLSGRDALGENNGLFFDFGSSHFWGIWMKDMKFAIDIIWLDENLEIVDVKTSVAPETYPESFTPSKKASFVLEVNAGFVEKYGIEPGQKAKFE